MFHEIPTDRPATPLLDGINSPADLRRLGTELLGQLSGELRHFLLYTVGQTGGHFGAGLGVVELTIALHYVFNTPQDKLIWDVGHQTYPHKILTGRREQMATLRKPDGLAPFPSQLESEYDTFGVGHSSTSISAALGIALSSSLQKNGSKTIVVIGDGAMTAGMAFEALNHVAATHADVLIILNDNAMSISENVGGLANYFARNISTKDVSPQSANTPDIVPGSIFRDLGFAYSGPVDGHDLPNLVKTLNLLKQARGPRILHLITTKGKGYGPAELSPVASHAMTKLEKQTDRAVENTLKTYSAIFGQWIVEKAKQDERLVAITPAMKEGSGLVRFAQLFPARFHDVAIAEQHAVTLAAGLATGGAKPVVAIYSTFLQRAYDQLIHDVALQNLDVLFAVDRASLLEDGPTHSGVFDLTFTRAIPNTIIMAPSDESEMTEMLNLGYDYPGPALVRYPRGNASKTRDQTPLELGKSRVIREGRRVAILCFGSLLEVCLSVASIADYSLVDMRFIKPLDEELLAALGASHEMLVTVEENAVMGGAGSGVNEVIANLGLTVVSLNLGIPDRFMPQDNPIDMRKACGLDQAGIAASIQARIRKLEEARGTSD